MPLKISDLLLSQVNISPDDTPYNIKATYFGWIHMYAVFITLGIILAIFASYLCMKYKKVPADSLIWSALLIIPMSLLGASFLGKINTDPSHPWIAEGDTVPFWSLFAFWQGGMSIHGGILFGIIGGFMFFPFVSKKTKVSLWMYADCIIPNIILGQVLGRWGNFFNHELLGNVVSYDQLKWLPAFIRDNCFSFDDFYHLGKIIYREPIFLYESFFNFIVWIVVMFGIPNITKIFSPKPWKLQPSTKKFSWKYTFKRFLHLTLKDKTMETWHEAWDRGFYAYHPSNAILEANLDTNKYNNSKKLYHLNNPHKYWITRCGMQTGWYFFGWNLVRFVLETRRDNDGDLFIMWNRPLDYAILIFLFIFGILLALYAQVLAPRFLRSNGYLFEKEYIDYHNLNTWDLPKRFINNDFIIGKNNYAVKLPQLIKNSTMKYLGYDSNFGDLFELINFKLEKTDDPKGEIVSFSVIIKPKKNNKKYFNECFLNINAKFNLNKIIKIVHVALSKNSKTLEKKIFINACQEKFLAERNFKKVKAYWDNIFENIDWQKSKILSINWDDIVVFDKISFNNTKNCVVSKYKLISSNFYYFKNKIKVKKS